MSELAPPPPEDSTGSSGEFEGTDDLAEAYQAYDADAMNAPEFDAMPQTPTELASEVRLSNLHAMEDRFDTDPDPTQQELDIGVYVEEIEPQVREAVLALRDKGYDTGNVMHAGFDANHDNAVQVMQLHTALTEEQASHLQYNGFAVHEGEVSFQPTDPTDLGAIKQTWDWLANNLPDRSEPVGPAMFGNAVKFREAAEDGTLFSAYRNDEFKMDMRGVKYSRSRDPFADLELPISEDPATAVRELTHLDQYYDLQDRLRNRPEPTQEELDLGEYAEAIEPQIRDAVFELRHKGYDTGSSGFFGEGHVQQRLNVHTPLDEATIASLAFHGIDADERSIRFNPTDPTDTDNIKATWDMVAGLLPDRGEPAPPAASGADFRYMHQNGLLTTEYMEQWLLQNGALAGQNLVLTKSLLNDGYDFGEDVYAPNAKALRRYHELQDLSREANS